LTRPYDGREATFWSGFVVTTVPRCLKLRTWVDDERTPRRAYPLGKRCAYELSFDRRGRA
jgi:hypothetical protein